MISFLLGYKRIYKDSLRRHAASMKTCCNSRRNALFNAYIAVYIFFLFSMLTAKERHVRFVSYLLRFQRGRVVKASALLHATPFNMSLAQVRIRPQVRIEPTTSELKG